MPQSKASCIPLFIWTLCSYMFAMFEIFHTSNLIASRNSKISKRFQSLACNWYPSWLRVILDYLWEFAESHLLSGFWSSFGCVTISHDWSSVNPISGSSLSQGFHSVLPSFSQFDFSFFFLFFFSHHRYFPSVLSFQLLCMYSLLLNTFPLFVHPISCIPLLFMSTFPIQTSMEDQTSSRIIPTIYKSKFATSLLHWPHPEHDQAEQVSSHPSASSFIGHLIYWLGHQWPQDLH